MCGSCKKRHEQDSINRDGGIFFFATALVVPQFFRPHRNQWASEVVVCAIPPYNPTPCPYNFATPRQQRMAARKAVSTAPLLVPPRGPLFTRVQTGLGRLVAQSSGGGHANNGLAEHTKTKKTTTQLTTIAHQAPFRWIPLTASAVAQAGAAAVVASNYGGGLLPGDAYHSTVHVQSDATLYVGTQGATRVYPQPQYATTTAADDAADNSSSQHCRPSIVTARYDVEAGGLLVVAPDPFTPLADSVWQQRQSIHLHHRQSGNDSNNNTVNDASDYASICWIDWVAAGRTARGEHWEARHGTSRTEFWCHINHQDAAEHPSPPKYPTLVDATRFDPAIARAALGPCAAYATVILVGPQVAAVRRRCRRLATALTRLHTATRQEEEEDDDNRHHGSASETSIHDNTLVNAADDNDGRTDWDVDALMANMAGPVYMGATAVDDNMAVVRLAATNNDDVYRVLHGALLPLQERLGLAVYGDRIRAVKSAGAPRAVPKDPSSAASTFRKPLNSDTAKPVSNLPSSMSPAVAWAAHMLTDSNLPTGGFAHSAGLEVAAQVGWLGALSTQSESSSPSSEEEAIATYAAATVHSTLSQVTPTLRRIHHTIAANGQLDAATWHDIQHELHALLRTNRPACEASLDQGASLWRLAQLNWIPSTVVTALSASTSASSSTPLHFAPVFGLVTATWGLSLEESRHLLAYSIGRDVVSAAVRLNRVGPLASVPLLARLHEAIPTLDHDSDPENDFAASTAPVLEALQPLHDVLAVRLFRT
jgi:urease accessory protein